MKPHIYIYNICYIFAFYLLILFLILNSGKRGCFFVARNKSYWNISWIFLLTFRFRFRCTLFSRVDRNIDKKMNFDFNFIKSWLQILVIIPFSSKSFLIIVLIFNLLLCFYSYWFSDPCFVVIYPPVLFLFTHLLIISLFNNIKLTSFFKIETWLDRFYKVR